MMDLKVLKTGQVTRLEVKHYTGSLDFPCSFCGLNSYDNYHFTKVDVFNNTVELHELAKDLENRTTTQNVESGIVDVVGAYIGRALDALKLSITSFGVFERMTTKATDKLGLPSYFLIAFISMMLIAIIFVVISAMIKKDV